MEAVLGSYGASGLANPRSRSFVWSASAAVAVGLAIVLGISLARPAKAVTLASMAEALENAEAVHMIHRGAKGTVYAEQWQKGRLRRYEHTMRGPEKSISGFDGTDRWSINPYDKCVEIGLEFPGDVEVQEGLDTTESIIERYRATSMANPSIERSRKGALEVVTYVGKTKSTFSKFKVEVTADPKTLLPVEQRTFNFTKERTWRLWQTTEFQYPTDLDDSIFSPTTPAGYVFYDYTEVLERIDSAFAGGAPQQTVNGVSISVVGAIQDAEGQVMVFWKGGAAPPLFAKSAVFATDGTQHVANFWFEDDDRTRERNYGIPPKNPPPKIPREKIVVKLRPLGYHKGEPFYCLRFNPGMVDPNLPQTYNVVLPVCAQTEPYIQQPPNWVKHEATGKEVGTATFRVTTMPVRYWHSVYRQLDPDYMSLIGNYPSTSIGMTKEQVAAYRTEAAKREMKRMMEQANRPLLRFGG